MRQAGFENACLIASWPVLLRVRRIPERQHARCAATELEMVAGLPAEVEARQWRPDAWAQRWLKFEGEDLCWEDGRWQRVAVDVSAKP